MKLVFGRIGWGWKMYGLMQIKRRPYWFIGFSRQATAGIDVIFAAPPTEGAKHAADI